MEKAAIAGAQAKAETQATEMGTPATQLGCQPGRDASNSRNASNRMDANSSKHIGDSRADNSSRNTRSCVNRFSICFCVFLGYTIGILSEVPTSDFPKSFLRRHIIRSSCDDVFANNDVTSPIHTGHFLR